MIVIAHLSDTHLDTGPRARERTARVVAQLDSMRGIDAVVVTGDIADHGAAEEYAEARRVLACARPTVFTTGNHDARGPFRAALGELNQVHRFPGFALVAMDSSIPGADGGLLDDAAVDWLDRVLADLAVPTFVCFHHPPVDLHIPYIDAIRLTAPHRLEQVLRRRPQVVATLCGHAHTATATTFAGRPLLVAPGVVSTLALPFDSTDELVDLDQPPAMAIHVWDEGRLTTHFRVVR